MPSVIWTRPALTALERHRQFLAETDPNLAVKAIQKIVEVGESLQTYPLIGALVEQTPAETSCHLWESWFCSALRYLKR